MSLTHTGYYHGSTENTINFFDFNKAKVDTPFGPAIYLTKKRKTAMHYTGINGSIYSVTLSGDLQYTINLNATYDKQTIVVQEILNNMFPKINNFKRFDDMRDVIHPFAADLKEINETLVENGIWMLYGELPVEECYGKKDHGIQYAVLHNRNLSIDT